MSPTLPLCSELLQAVERERVYVLEVGKGGVAFLFCFICLGFLVAVACFFEVHPPVHSHQHSLVLQD